MRGERKHITYPFGKSWVYLSGVLFFLSLIFMLMLSKGDINVIGLYFLATFVTAVPSYIIKIRIYTKKAKDYDREAPKRGITIRALVMLFFLGLILLVIPFIFVHFFGSYAGLILVNSYISGVNISEIIIYLIHCT